jgi:hypothetical protein
VIVAYSGGSLAHGLAFDGVHSQKELLEPFCPPLLLGVVADDPVQLPKQVGTTHPMGEFVLPRVKGDTSQLSVKNDLKGA